MTTRELDVAKMVEANQKGATIYKGQIKTPFGKVELHVPDMMTFGPNSPVSVQDWVDGTSFEEFVNKKPELGRAAVEQLSKLWLSEALFGGGFYHADLHQGNLRVGMHDQIPELNILDFGMAGTLEPTLQSRFLAFGALIESRDPSLMARIIWELSVQEKNTITRDELERIITNEIIRQDAINMAPWPFYEWAALAVNSGIRFPSELTTLNRGAFFVFRMLEDQQSSVTLPSIIKDLVIRSPIRAARVINSTKTISKSEWAKALYNQAQGIRPKLKPVVIPLPEKVNKPMTPGMCRAAFGY